MRKWTIVAGMVLGVLTLSAAASLVEVRDEAIKEVMKVAMKGQLAKKVYSGEGSEDDKKELLRLFEKLAKASPPHGEPASWKEKTDALVDAAKATLDGKPGATDRLKKESANCKACHSIHKGQ